MKIVISENEFYEISLPEKVKLEELSEIQKRFTDLVKVFGRFSSFQETDSSTSNKSSSGNRKITKVFGKYDISWRQDRNKAIELIKLHYFGNKEDKEQTARKYGYENWGLLNRGFTNVKRKFNITAKEVGLKRFPTNAESIKGNFEVLKLSKTDEKKSEKKDDSENSENSEPIVNTEKEEPKINLEEL